VADNGEESEDESEGSDDPDDRDYEGEEGDRGILARMARDYLVCQPTSKEIDGTFSKGRGCYLGVFRLVFLLKIKKKVRFFLRL